MAPEDDVSRYTVELIDGNRIAVFFGGEEVCIAPDLEQAAVRAAEDACSGEREDHPDVVHDVASETGQMVDNVRHMRFFREQVAEAIAAEWDDPIPAFAPAP